VEVRSDLITNDPDLPLIKLAVAADIKPVPAFVRRIENADLINGERVGTFKVWPTAHPRITLEKGESLAFSLRIWEDAANTNQIALDREKRGGSSYQAASVPGEAHVGNLPVLPRAALTTTVRREGTSHTYWLEVKVGPLATPGSFHSSLVIPPGQRELSTLRSLDLMVVIR
jgi:hypothetical protein